MCINNLYAWLGALSVLPIDIIQTMCYVYGFTQIELHILDFLALVEWWKWAYMLIRRMETEIYKKCRGTSVTPRLYFFYKSFTYQSEMDAINHVVIVLSNI